MSGKVKIFGKKIEPKALEQFRSAMEQDFAIKGALMPDAHTGYSLPIGGVVATDGVVVPAWVGYDIGCGMCALPTTFRRRDIENMRHEIFRGIYRRIPVGFNVNDTPPDTSLDPRKLSGTGRRAFESRKGFKALGSLGGGNHFIEIGYDESDRIWIVIHSGSRGVGHGIATEYMKIASGDKRAREGHFGLDAKSDAGRAYINDMNWALEFALENRREMMRRIVDETGRYCEGDAVWSRLINRNHNHAEFKNGLWIHRKGATHAEEGMLGVIPGNMRDGSFIVRGKGNPDSLWSSSHGAGRIMGRRQARKKLSPRKFMETMQGITARVGRGTLDESPFAYKNIFDVMRQQSDMIEVLHHIRPLINIKG